MSNLIPENGFAADFRIQGARGRLIDTLFSNTDYINILASSTWKQTKIFLIYGLQNDGGSGNGAWPISETDDVFAWAISLNWSSGS